MRPINLSNIAEKAEGEFNRLKPGAYQCAIMEVEDFPEKEYLRLLVDIVTGEYKDYFSDDFYADKPFAHSIIMSYKDSALGMLKGRLHVITDCNPGFDAEAAFGAGKEQMLVGKAVGVVFREEEYYNRKTGEFEMGGARPDRLCRLDEIDDPKNASPKPRTLSDSQKRAALARAGEDPDEWLRAKRLGAQGVKSADVYDDDIPFD